MSRIGKLPITIKENANVTLTGNKISVSGPKGELSFIFSDSILVSIENNIISVSPKEDVAESRKLFGLTRTLIDNMVEGVTQGFEKILEFKGTGYRVAVEGSKVVLHMGFSHPVNLEIPEGLGVKVEKNHIIVSGYDKQKVGQFAAKIRDVKKPEPYKGKGIKYKNEVVRRKAGKAAGK